MSHAIYAVSIGLREKDKAMEVCNSISSVCSAANTKGKYGLWPVSLEKKMS
jgi:hypothetical protein